jgi:hypothetical protein
LARSRYGAIEWTYAEPIAEALVKSDEFRSWFVGQTEFSGYALQAKLLNNEMKAKRSKSAQNWWRSHFTETCRCDGCQGKETDLLAIFEASGGFRFAVHAELKRPGDRFEEDAVQSYGYQLRADCWAAKAPLRVPFHNAGTSMVLFSERDNKRHAAHLGNFRSSITFEQIVRRFPGMLPG